jgi:endonuclease YncB( thermonuclease family)
LDSADPRSYVRKTFQNLPKLKKIRKRRVAFYLLPLILWFGTLSSASSAKDIAARDTDEFLRSLGLDREYHKCIAVADGDTLTLEGLETVRFIGVDTPEKNHPLLPVQFMSKEASAFTEKICLGKKIRLEYDSYDKDKRGNYGRVLGYVYLEDGTFLQEELIKNGYAIAYTKYPLDAGRKARFLAWEQAAKTRRVGLWQDDGFSEVLWILAQKQPLLQVAKKSNGQWKIGFGSWVLQPVPYGDIESNLDQLYSAIYEFSPRELQTKLIKMQYKVEPSPDNDQSSIFVIGMAHKKWGVIHKNHSLARVLPGQLDVELKRLSDWINAYNEEALGKVLLKNHYRLIPDQSINSVEQKKIATPFLTIYEVKAANKNTIPWDLAGNYIGKYMAVEGKIARAHNSGKACFLNFHNNWTRYFSLVIFDNVFHRFPEKPEEFYLDKWVRVSGKIKMFRGRPEIVVDRPKQIKIIVNP